MKFRTANFLCLAVSAGVALLLSVLLSKLMGAAYGFAAGSVAFVWLTYYFRCQFFIASVLFGLSLLVLAIVAAFQGPIVQIGGVPPEDVSWRAAIALTLVILSPEILIPLAAAVATHVLLSRRARVERLH